MNSQSLAHAESPPRSWYAETQAFALRVFPDPRVPFAALLAGYLLLGFTILGFNRSPLQVGLTMLSCCALEVGLHRIFKGRWIWPMSAFITSMGLSLLLNYSHDHWLLLFPAFVAIGTKYVFTLDGKHVYNPAQIAVVASLLFTGQLITAAPAYQWNGVGSMAYFILFPGLMIVLPTVNRLPLVGSFLLSYTVLTALRAWIMRHHLPFETLFWGTLSSPSFLLFSFFMITDPATSPKDSRTQIWVGIALAVLDLALHLKQSYYTFFYAAFIVASFRFAQQHMRRAVNEGLTNWFRNRFVVSGYWRRPALLFGMGLVGHQAYDKVIYPSVLAERPGWGFVEETRERGIEFEWGAVYDQLDPGVQHIAKWILSVGSSVAVADIDGDGYQDLCLISMLGTPETRVVLYRNVEGKRFERVPLPALQEKLDDPRKHGLPTMPVFADVDNDGRKDLLLSFAFGEPVLLMNRLVGGRIEFVDETTKRGLAGEYTNSIAATFLDVNRDGRLDLWIANVLPDNLPGYKEARRLNLFDLPEPEYPGDERPYHFMHSSWNMAKNGGQADLFLQDESGRFVKQDNAEWGLEDTGWALALGAADLDQDGWTDMYVANDFGPDMLYFNVDGKRFRAKQGRIFGSIGRDTYKGMNVSIADFEGDGWLDVYVSNVHQHLQAEGSLLWMFRAPRAPGADPVIEDEATQRGALNEQRFGWGAAAADFDNDGRVDIAQANGMVDDSRDKKWDKCPDYWYVNEKIARSPPSIHSFANRWGDIRGMCIHHLEKNRLYLNRGPRAKPQFIDIADHVGLGHASNYRGIAAADFDNDGRMDLVVTNMFRTPQVHMNRPDAGSSIAGWIGFELSGDGKTCNRDAYGTRVRLVDGKGETILTAEAQGVSGFSAQSDRRLHFGLGNRSEAVTLEVDWCGNEKRLYGPFEPNRYHKVPGSG